MLMRRWLLLILIGTVVSLSIAECASSLVLFRFYAHKELPFQPNGMAITYLFKKAFGLFPPVSFTADPPYMFRPDPILGYALNPGRYQVIEDSGGNGLHGFKVTIGADGERATSYSQQLSSRRLYVLGNSHAWGFGLDDEMTIAWMLQTRLKEFKVLNLSVTGYSELQSLLQFRALAPQLTGDDIVVFSYDDDLMHNNVGDTAEAFVHPFEGELAKPGDFDDLRLPFGYLSTGGVIGIRYVPMSCARNPASCPPGPGRIVDGRQVTEAIFREVLEQHCRLVIAFIGGQDDDPIISFLRSSGVPIADMRFPKSTIDKNDFLPERYHVGAFANFARFEELFRTLSSIGPDRPPVPALAVHG